MQQRLNVATSAQFDPKTIATERFPYIFGAQYYRAPTPEPECWEYDFQHMHELGFNAVKFFVQWRWSHRAEQSYYFDDLDRLMDLAQTYGLGVTLNTLLDMTPTWLFRAYPDAKQIDASGHVVEPYAIGHRSIGGHPGPCYRHPEALALRKQFMTEAITHFRGHPALSMWDVWNEPELSFQQRTPQMANMVCYCEHCRLGFHDWLQAKYGDLDRLNHVWGRCYSAWDDVEMPRNPSTITDFVDWREFHVDTLTNDAVWRLDLVKQLDPAHGRYLHVVPVYFSPVTCVDDYAIAEPCEVFAATMNGTPAMTIQVMSAARGKICYNVENHINHGCTSLHQPIVEREALLHNLLPQLGLGIKGCLFWQYRPEVLGAEAPAWGLVHLDGTDRPVTHAVRDYWATLAPHTARLLHAKPATPRVGILRSRKNEIFHFAIQDSVAALNKAIDAYTNALYWRSIPFCYVPESRLVANDLDDIHVLVLPNAYYLSEAETAALDRWVRAGGVLLSEAHLAGYNATTGRHSRVLPGGGLAASWGLREVESTSSYHLRLKEREDAEGGITEDVRKALSAFGNTGGFYFPQQLANGKEVLGAFRYAEVAVEGIDGSSCFATVAVGQGHVCYCGTNFGEAADCNDAGLQAMLDQALALADMTPTRKLTTDIPHTVRLDILAGNAGERFAVVVSQSDQSQTITLEGQESWRGIFTDTLWTLDGRTTVTIPAKFAELFILE